MMVKILLGAWAVVAVAVLYGSITTLLGVLVVACLLTVFWWRRWPHPRINRARALLLPRSKSASMVNRWGDSARQKSGMASPLDVARFGSSHTVRRIATTVRPSLGDLTARERLMQVRTRDVAVELCRVGLMRVWASVEDVILVFGGPRTGKSGWMGGRIIDAPGAVVVTSTRTDLHDRTHRLRRRSGPVYVFNTTGIAGLDSTITFDPLTGCANPETPPERAADMIPRASGEKEQWADLARAALGALMHAAALGGHSMLTVQRWVADPDKAKATVIKLLRQSPAPGYVEDARQFLECNTRTRSSITTSIMPALRYLNSPAARRATEGGTPFNVAELLRQRGTVYIIGKEADHVAALMAGLTGYIAREARRIAGDQPGGRLDPPLGLYLDEAAQIAPPLPEWSSDMGGAGLTICAAFQSRAQMIERWGKAGAGIILNNAGAIMMYGGTKDPDDLEAWGLLFGKRDEIVETTNKQGEVTSRSPRQVPVITSAQLSNIPNRRVAVLRRGMPPAVGRARMAWKRWDVRLLRLREILQGWRSSTSTSTPVSSPLEVEAPGLVEVEILTSTSTSPSVREEEEHRV